MKYISIILLSFLLFSCSTTKNIEIPKPIEPEKKEVSYDTLLQKNNLKTLRFASDLKLNISGNITSATAKISIAGDDSISVTLYGPFGVTIAKLYSNKDYFIFYNVFQNQVLEGAPTKENFRRVMDLDFSFDDAIHILRNEPAGDFTKFKIEDTQDSKSLLFKSLDEDYVSYALYSMIENALIQLQKKNLEGKLIANIFYDRFINVNGINYPSTILIKYPGEKTEVSFNSSEIEINNSLNETFRFNIPSSAKRKRI